MLRVSCDGSVLCLQYVNRSFVDLSGYSKDEVLGKPAVDILRTFDTKAVCCVHSSSRPDTALQ